MSELNKILKEDEEVLWKRVKDVKINVSLYLLLILPPFCLFIFLVIILTGMTALNIGEASIGISIIITGLAAIIAACLLVSNIVIGSNRRFRRILGFSSNEELKKDYEVIQAITNQRVLLKDVRNVKAIKRYDKKRPILKVDFNKDYISINLESIEIIQLLIRSHEIRFLYNSWNTPNLIHFNLSRPKEKAQQNISEVMETLRKHFILEIISGLNKFEAKYSFKLK